MKALQIANDYLNPLFAKMFYAMKCKGINNKVIVPISFGGIVSDDWDNDVSVLECFNRIDRLFFFGKQRKIFEAIDSNMSVDEYDIIHAHTVFSAGYTAMKLKEKYSIPYIVAVRNTDVNAFFKYMLHLRKTGIKVLKNADGIVFLSPAYMNMVIKKYVPQNCKEEIKRKSVVIPNGISQVFFNKMSNSKAYNHNRVLTLLYVGEISVNKNIETIIEVAKIRRESKQETKVIIVGNIVDARCERYLKDDIVEYHNRCNQEELIEYYRNADVFIMPSRTETFGLVYVEAMSQGLPVLYTRGQGFDGHFADGVVGYGVDDKNPFDIVEKIDLVLANYKTISQNCITLCSRFDWLEIAEQYDSLYRKLTI